MKIAFLTSYNSDLIKKDFDELFRQRSSLVESWWGGYSLHEQSVFDSQSAFYRFEPSVVLIHYEIESLLGDLITDPLTFDEINREKILDSTKNKIKSIIKTVNKKLPGAKIVFENFIIRSPLSLGILDSNIKLGVNEIVSSLNLFLYELKNEFHNGLIIHDYSGLISCYGKNNVFDFRLHRLAKYPFEKSFNKILFEHLYSIINVLVKPRKKCIVVDLDNTLWGGIIDQDGIENIQLGHLGIGEAFTQFQNTIMSYYHRGFLLAICSKNNYEEVIEVIEKHPDMILRKKYFSSIKINWLDKTVNLKSIANDLNIGSDALVFLDDNPAECELVRQQLPEVEVINLTGDPDNYIYQLLSIDSLNTIVLTEEDRSRNQMFAADEKRKEFEISFSNLDDYYKSLQMTAFISVNNFSHLSRVAQLTQKTNQFNLTTRRYSIEEIKKYADNSSYKIYTLRLVDKFGDNGIVLVAIVMKDNYEWIIDTFLMSCRVIGRQAETALLNTILKDAQNEDARIVKGIFIETKKNAPASDLFERHNFKKTNETEWVINLPTQYQTHHIKINHEDK
jgi:FkbH-like protein